MDLTVAKLFLKRKGRYAEKSLRQHLMAGRLGLPAFCQNVQIVGFAVMCISNKILLHRRGFSVCLPLVLCN